MQGSPTSDSAERRRSTRIELSIPVTIRGIDLLSQPFEEHTQTLSLNTFGCRYPSKHHLPKNTWVTLEVPGHDEFESPHRVRARVVWIQKPRSVREPFQVSVELESPANIWKLADAPNDWSYIPEFMPEREVHPADFMQDDRLFGLKINEASSTLLPSSSTTPTPEHTHFSLSSSPSPEAPSFPDASSSPSAPLYTSSDFFPSPDSSPSDASSESLPSTNPFASLLSNATYLSSSDPSSFDTPLLRELRAHIESQAARAVGDATLRASTSWQQTAEATEKKRLEDAEVSFRKWIEDFEHQRLAANAEIAQRATKEIAGARDEIAAHFTDQMAWVREELRSDLKEEFSSHIDQMRKLVSELERGAESLRAEASVANSASERMAQMHGSLEATEARIDQRMLEIQHSAEPTASNLEALGAEWRERLSAQMSQARSEWEELLQSSLDSAAQKLVSRFAAGSQTALEGAEKGLESRIAQFRDPVIHSVTDAQQNFERMRGSLEGDLQRAQVSLGEIERSANRMREMAAQIDAASQEAVNQLHRRVEGALEAQIAQLQRTAEIIAAGLPQRIQPAIDSSVQQFMDRTLAEVDARLTPRLARIPELIRELNSREIEVEESLRLYRERLRQAADSSGREAQEQLGSVMGDARQHFESIRADILSHWNEQLQTGATQAAQSTAEEFSKVGERSLQHAQERIDALSQESLQKAENVFEERTRLALERLEQVIQERQTSFANEMHGQLEASTAHATRQAQAELEHSSGAALAAFEQRASDVSEQALQAFAGSADANIADKVKRAEAVAEDIRKNIEEVARMLLDRYCDQMAAHSEQQLAEARESHSREFSAALEDARREREAQQSQWSESLHHLNEESLRNYENQLHHTNEIWVDAAVQKLNDKGQQSLAALSQSGERALRNSLVSIFEEVAASLRQKIDEGAPSSGSNRSQGENFSDSLNPERNDEGSEASAPPSILAQSASQGASA